jgi:hypothetical protein
MIEEVLTGQGPMPAGRGNKPPRGTLLQLEESAGIVQGRFAESPDVIAFRQIGSESSRRVSTYSVTGTLDGPRVRLSFSAESGRTFEVDGLVNEGVIKGTYVSRCSTARSQATESGQFEIERF